MPTPGKKSRVCPPREWSPGSLPSTVMAKVCSVSPLNGEATPALLHELFHFHGKIARIAIIDAVGYVEFHRASSATTALMFDQTQFLGNTVAVALSERVLPEDAWTPEAAALAKAESKAKAKAAARAAPAAAVAKEPESSRSSEESFQEVPPAAAPAVSAAAAVPAAGNTAASSRSNASKAELCARRRRACLEQLGLEPLNSPLALLAVTLGGLLIIATS